MNAQISILQAEVAQPARGGGILLLLLLAIACFFIIRVIKKNKRKHAIPHGTCPYCNNSIDAEARFCENCGNKIK